MSVHGGWGWQRAGATQCPLAELCRLAGPEDPGLRTGNWLVLA